ncbi:hypothetical protein ACVIHH_005719 [Bradyrhizobium sp. USDA 4518]|nr:hypothetical protein [Bradyrhizobium sp. USDA 4545]MCP1848267.1 hypothetical protein [Bradyrhizobium sp. USDA 4541]MCP1912053.1 hypothetical protein [Bradyrhizobium elkanii]MCP1922772.1 hypothetical protein [Bradyrhizobium sp. USDA 4532]
MMWTWLTHARFLRLSPRAGRGRAALADRVRGALRALLSQLYVPIDAPHPNPLPARAGRGGALDRRRT